MAQSVLLNRQKRLAKASSNASCMRLALGQFSPCSARLSAWTLIQQDALLDGSQVASAAFMKSVLLKIVSEISNIGSRARRLDAFTLNKRDTHMRTCTRTHMEESYSRCRASCTRSECGR